MRPSINWIYHDPKVSDLSYLDPQDIHAENPREYCGWASEILRQKDG